MGLTHETMKYQKINLTWDTGSRASVTLDISYRLQSPASSEEERVLNLSQRENICHAICCIHPYGLDIVWSVIPQENSPVAYSQFSFACTQFSFLYMSFLPWKCVGSAICSHKRSKWILLFLHPLQDIHTRANLTDLSSIFTLFQYRLKGIGMNPTWYLKTFGLSLLN